MTGVRVVLLWAVAGILIHQAWCHPSPCSAGNKTSCLDEVRDYFDSTQWWFGDPFSSECPGVTPGSDVSTTFKCHNPSSYKTIGSRLLQRNNFDVDSIEQVLRIRYFAPSGGYHACGHHYPIPALRMTHDVDSVHVLYQDSWSLQRRPAVIWEARPDTLYSLVAYDVGEMRLCGMWVNIDGPDSALGQEVVPYGSFLNPVDRKALLVFALFEQNQTISQGAIDAVKQDFLASTTREYLLTSALSHAGHPIQDPIALAYLSIWPDAYSIQRYKEMSLINNCPFLAARKPALLKIMDVFSLTNRYSTAYDEMGIRYFDNLDVQVEVFYWSDAITFNSCCSVQDEPDQLLTIEPLATTPASPVHLRNSPDMVLSPVLSGDSTFFLGKWFTVLLLDVTDAYANISNPMTSVLWSVTDHQGPSIPGRGKVHHNYTMPSPVVGETRMYMVFVFRQQSRLGADFSLDEFCINGDAESCNLDLYQLVSTHNLHFSGVNWFRAKADAYIRWKTYENHPERQDSACHGVKGYATPCPVPTTAPPTTPPPTLGPTRRPGGNRAGHVTPSWSLQTYLLLMFVMSFTMNQFFFAKLA